MNGKNPCDVCEGKKRKSECGHCILDRIAPSAECGNHDCFLHMETGCALKLDDVCKASDKFEADYRDYDCSDCVHCKEKENGMLMCEESGEEVGRWDSACEDFEEAENDG